MFDKDNCLACIHCYSRNLPSHPDAQTLPHHDKIVPELKVPTLLRMHCSTDAVPVAIRAGNIGCVVRMQTGFWARKRAYREQHGGYAVRCRPHSGIIRKLYSPSFILLPLAAQLGHAAGRVRRTPHWGVRPAAPRSEAGVRVRERRAHVL